MESLLEQLLEQMEEHRNRIERALERVPEEKLWERPRDGLNSVGNLCVHLVGNESHYIGRIVGGTGYERDRPAEFNAESGAPAAQILAALADARATTERIFAELTAADFSREVDSNWPPEPTVLRVILHVAQHYAFHTGQIILLARLLQPGSERILDWGH
jgi:uncharacterized damage-inducible protein DinB